MATIVTDPTPNARQRISEAVKRLPWLTEAQAALGWGIILILVALLGAIYLHQTSRIAITGRQIQILQSNLDDIKRQNSMIEFDIAAAQSLERLETRGVALGFVRAQAEDIQYLIVPGYPEATPTPPAAIIQLEEPFVPAQSMSEAFWLLLTNRISDLVQGESSEQ